MISNARKTRAGMKYFIVSLSICAVMAVFCPFLLAEEKLPLVISADGIETLAGRHVRAAGVMEKKTSSPSGKYRLKFADGSYLPVWGACASCESFDLQPVSVIAWVAQCGPKVQCDGAIGLKNAGSVQMDEDSQAIVAEVLPFIGTEDKDAKVSFSNLRVSGVKAFLDVFVVKAGTEDARAVSYLCFLVKNNGKWRVKMKQDLSDF
jgi:hypothetical protein